MTFKAPVAAKTGEAISTRLVETNEQDLMPREVAIAVDYSTVNDRDALAIGGSEDVIRQVPLRRSPPPIWQRRTHEDR